MSEDHQDFSITVSEPTPPPKLRWLRWSWRWLRPSMQFSLYSLLMLTVAAAGVFQWWTRPQTVEVVLDEGALVLKYQVARGQAHGWWTAWTGPGRMIVRGHYFKGTPNGAWQGWHGNGRPHFAGQYAQGQPTGRWQEWDDSGQLLRDFTFPLAAPSQPTLPTVRYTPAPTVVPQLLASFASPDLAASADSVRLLLALGEQSAAGLGTLLQHEDPLVRRHAMLLLLHLGPQAKPAVGSLASALDDPTLRGPAIIALGNIGPAAQSALPQLEKHLPSTNPALRVIWLTQMARIAPTPEVIQSMIDCLSMELTNEHMESAIALSDSQRVYQDIEQENSFLAYPQEISYKEWPDGPSGLMREYVARGLLFAGPNVIPAIKKIKNEMPDGDLKTWIHIFIVRDKGQQEINHAWGRYDDW